MPGSSRMTRGTGIISRIKATKSFHLGTSDMEVTEKVANVTLTSVNILAMNATPVAILAAPPTGQALIVDSIIFKMVTTATGYANGGVVSLVYHGGATAAHAGTVAAAVVTAGAGTSFTELGPAVAATGTTIVAATGIDITNASAAFITGTGTAVVQIRYRIVTLP